MLKSEIRKQALNQRLLLNNDDYNQLNNQLLLQFSSLNFNKINVIHIFLPIVEKREPNTLLFINWLQSNHPEIKIIVPKADFETGLMTNHEFMGLDNLKKSNYNIPEPLQAPIYLGKIDWVIIPLLAFDSRGYRAGYGKGFYDRFLENINAQKIGLSLFPAIDKIDDVHENDIKLNTCITPTEIIKF
jgi:5-formyltetrahydrofolate cyclo-ligase